VTGGTAVARRYAKAVFALAKRDDRVEAIGRELDTIAAELEGHDELRAFLGRPWEAPRAKRAAVTEVATLLGVSPLARDLAGMLAARGRIGALRQIGQAYAELVDADQGRARARVRTAIALTGDERAVLAQALGRALGGKRVLLDEVVDPGLLGGFVAEVGSFVLDGSIDGQLARIRERLVRGQG
jgi:F-type H+-transporting ATPase subunit delta